MITSLPRDSDFENRQADTLAFEARRGNFRHQYNLFGDFGGNNTKISLKVPKIKTKIMRYFRLWVQLVWATQGH